MFKLMKYEFIKQGMSKMVMLGIFAILQVLFFVGIATDNEGLYMIVSTLLLFFGFGSIIFLGIETINIYSKDLREKSSYMLFLTPRTTYSIVGAKILTFSVIIAISSAILFLFAIIDIGMLAVHSEQIKTFREFSQIIFGMDISDLVRYSDIALIVTVVMLQWLMFITSAFLAITLSSTFLYNFKAKGMISFIIFVILNFVFSYVIEEASNLTADSSYVV